MLPRDTGIKESVSREQLWKYDTWICSTCGQCSLNYPRIGWSTLDNEILCIECFLSEHNSHDLLCNAYIDENRFIRLSKPEIEDIPTEKEYWYYWVWTLAPNRKIEEVRTNIDKLVGRDLGIFYLDISFEHGEKSGREHYNMRIKSSRCIKAQRVKQYEKCGKIHKQTIRVHTEENWMAVGNYCSKENEIEILINKS